MGIEYGFPWVIERVAGKFFFSPLVSSRGIRDDIEEEDDQVSDPLDVTSAIVSLPQQWLCPTPLSIFLSYTLYIYVCIDLHQFTDWSIKMCFW